MNEIDRRTPEQHMADVAAATLGRLVCLDTELEYLAGQFGMLSAWVCEHLAGPPDAAEHLRVAAGMVAHLRCCTPEVVRDIATTLPISGLDY